MINEDTGESPDRSKPEGVQEEFHSNMLNAIHSLYAKIQSLFSFKIPYSV